MDGQSHLRGPMGGMILFLIAECLYTYNIICPVLRDMTRPDSILLRAARGQEPEELMRAINEGRSVSAASSGTLEFPKNRAEYSAQLESIVPDIAARFGPRAAMASHWLAREIRVGHRSHKTLGRIRIPH